MNQTQVTSPRTARIEVYGALRTYAPPRFPKLTVTGIRTALPSSICVIILVGHVRLAAEMNTNFRIW
jgi:hypothetical protein